MEKINFVNGIAPALNATNLNQMQDNVENAIEDIWSNLPTIPIYSYTADNIEWFKNYTIANITPIGISFWDLSLNGVRSMAIVIKANSDYLSFIQFSYSINAIQYKYTAGNWTTREL